MFSLVGNVTLLIFSLSRVNKNQQIQKYFIRNTAVANILLTAIAMPSNIVHVACKLAGLQSSNSIKGNLRKCENISCIIRYLVTFSLNNASLMFVTSLTVYKRDLVVRAPFGKVPRITSYNCHKITLIQWIFSTLPHTLIGCSYIYLMVVYNVAPCEPAGHFAKKAHWYTTVFETIWSSTVFSFCVFLIIRSGMKIKSFAYKQFMQTSILQRIHGTRKINFLKINAIFSYAVAFIAIWITVLIIAFSSTFFPPEWYDQGFNIAYFLAHISTVVCPTVYLVSDRNFEHFVLRTLSRRNKTTPLNVIPARE